MTRTLIIMDLIYHEMRLKICYNCLNCLGEVFGINYNRKVFHETLQLDS